MKKVYVEVIKDKKIKASGIIYVTDIERKEVPPVLIKEQLEINNVSLYPLIREEGTNIFKGLASIIALADRGYRVSFKEFREKRDENNTK